MLEEHLRANSAGLDLDTDLEVHAALAWYRTAARLKEAQDAGTSLAEVVVFDGTSSSSVEVAMYEGNAGIDENYGNGDRLVTTDEYQRFSEGGSKRAISAIMDRFHEAMSRPPAEWATPESPIGEPEGGIEQLLADVEAAGGAVE